jgi:hypothetical protein
MGDWYFALFLPSEKMENFPTSYIKLRIVVFYNQFWYGIAGHNTRAINARK